MMSITSSSSWYNALANRGGEWSRIEAGIVRTTTDEFREQRQHVDANLLQLAQEISQSKHHDTNNAITPSVKPVQLSIFDGLLDSLDWNIIESRVFSLHAAVESYSDDQELGPEHDHVAFELYYSISESIALLQPMLQSITRSGSIKHSKHVQLAEAFDILEKSQLKLTRQSNIALEPVHVFMQYSADNHTFLMSIAEAMKRCLDHPSDDIGFGSLINQIITTLDEDRVRLQRVMSTFKSINHFHQFLHSTYLRPFLKLIDTSVHQSINRSSSKSLLCELRSRLIDWIEVHARFASSTETLFGFQPAHTARFAAIINQTDCKRINIALADEIAQGLIHLTNDQYLDWSTTTIIESNAIATCDIFTSSFHLTALIESIVTILVGSESVDMSVDALRMLGEVIEIHSQVLTTMARDASRLQRYIAPSFTSNLQHLFTTLSSLATIQKSTATNCIRLVACSEQKSLGVLNNINVHIGACVASNIGQTLDSICHLIDRSIHRMVALIDMTDWSQKRDLPPMLRPKVTTVNAAIANIHLFVQSVVEQCQRIVGGHGVMHRLLLHTTLSTSMTLLAVFYRLRPSRFHFAQFMLDLKAAFAVVRHWRGYLYHSLLKSPSRLNDGARLTGVDRSCSEFGIAVALLDTSPKLLGPRLSTLERALERTSSHSITSDVLQKTLDSLGGHLSNQCPMEMPLVTERVPVVDCISFLSSSCVLAAIPSSQILSTNCDDLNIVRTRMSQWMLKRYDLQDDDFPALTDQEVAQVGTIKQIAVEFATAQ